jgi:hypothetical protein
VRRALDDDLRGVPRAGQHTLIAMARTLAECIDASPGEVFKITQAAHELRQVLDALALDDDDELAELAAVVRATLAGDEPGPT